jgi:hypothetical protein
VEKREHSVFDMLRALLPGDGLILVTALVASPGDAFGQNEVVPLPVSPASFQAVQDFIWQSIETKAGATEAGLPLFVGNGPYPGSAFYASRVTYDGLYTCNTWTAEALRAGGIPVTADAVVLADQIMGQLRWRAAKP